MTVRRLYTELDSHELGRWQAYERVAGPLGGHRGDIQAGVIASTIANVYRGQNTDPMSADDFVPDWDQEG